MLPLGTKAPEFRLPDPAGKLVSSHDFDKAPALLVAFICNHCPYVKHIRDRLPISPSAIRSAACRGGHQFQRRRSAIPTTARRRWPKRSSWRATHFRTSTTRRRQWRKAYQAACTPDFFLFDSDQRLAYRGQFDDSRPKNDRPVTGADLRAALDAVLAGQPGARRSKAQHRLQHQVESGTRRKLDPPSVAGSPEQEKSHVKHATVEVRPANSAI